MHVHFQPPLTVHVFCFPFPPETPTSHNRTTRKTHPQGGMDPRLWSVIVAAHTFTIPTYTFDLSPWLGALNAIPTAGSKPHTITLELYGASGSDWHVATTLLLWRAPGIRRITARTPVEVQSSNGLSKPTASVCRGANIEVAGTCVMEVRDRSLSATSVLLIDGAEWEASVRYEMASYTNVIPYNNTNGWCQWRQATGPVEAAFYLGRGVRHFASGARGGGSGGGGGSRRGGARSAGAGEQVARTGGLTTKVQQPAAWQPQQQQQQQQQQKVSLPTTATTATIPDAPFRRPSRRRLAAAAAAPPRADKKPAPLDFVTQAFVRVEWTQNGGIGKGEPFELSSNTTHLSPSVYAPLDAGSCAEARRRPPVIAVGALRHYQRLIMVDLYNTSSPEIPDSDVTHTASLNSSIGAVIGGGGDAAPLAGCLSWTAACAFGAPRVWRSDLVVDAAPEVCGAAGKAGLGGVEGLAGAS